MNSFLNQWRSHLMYAGFFSLFINVLQLTFSIYMLLIYDKVLTSYSLPTLIVLTIIAVSALFVNAMLEIVRSRLLVHMSVSMDMQLSQPVLAEMLKTSVVPGKKTEVALRDVSLLRSYLSGSAVFAFFDVPWMPIFFGLIFILNPILGFTAIGGGLIITTLGILQDRVARRPLENANRLANVSQELVGLGMRNAEAVRSMGMIGALAERWNRLNDAVIQLQTGASNAAGILQAATKTMRMLMQVSIYGIGAWLTLRGECTPGIMIAASIIIGRGLAPIEQGMAAYKQTADAMAAYRRLQAFQSMPPVRPPMDLPEPQGNLSCENVSLLGSGNKYILQGVHFQIEQGDALGMIGPSAAGKSSLCRVLIGLWPPTAGTVRLDGADIFTWDPEKLGKHLGYLPQNVELFSGTVGENIARMGIVDPELVVEAATLAGAHELILHLPKGYDTDIGTAGSILSGGQKQRVGLARALYGNPAFVILDEPSSNLDEEGEHALLDALATLKEKKVTVIVVSHKMSTLTSMDKLLVLQQGRVAMFGVREQVLQALAGEQKPVQRKTALSKPVGSMLTA